MSNRVPRDYCHTIGSDNSIHDVSSGVIRVRFESLNEIDTKEFQAKVLWKSNSSDTLDFSKSFATNASKTVDTNTNYAELSFNLSEIYPSGANYGHNFSDQTPDPDSDIKLQITENGDVKYAVALSAKQLYDLPRSIRLQENSTERAGDILKQDANLTNERNIVIDFCGGITGFTSVATRDISWIRDICMSTVETPGADSTLHWKAVADQSSNVSTGRGTSRFEVSLSGDQVFDASHLYLKAHLIVPGGVEAPQPDVSLVTLDLSAHVGNLASLQKVELLETTGFRTIYNTPDVMYVHGSGLYRDRAMSQEIIDMSYLIAGRNYYFYSLDGGTAVAAGNGAYPGVNMEGLLTRMTWDRSVIGQTTSLTNTTRFATSSIPIVADVSHAFSGIKDKTNVKFIGNDVGDASSSIAYRLTFSHPKPSDFRFDGAPSRLEFDKVGKHVGAGKHDIEVGVHDSSCVDISFVIRTPTIQSSVSLENLFIMSKTHLLYGAGISDVSSGLLPNIIYPKEYLYGIPSDFDDKKIGNDWVGIVTMSGDNLLKTRVNSKYDGDEYNRYFLPAVHGDTNRTFFDVNQPTNYVEISLNQMLPSGVSAEWFDASYIEYSTYAGTDFEPPENAWISVSFDKAPYGMIKGTKNDTVAFSICGEYLDSHNIWLKQHFRMHEKQTASDTLGTRDISFVRDFSAHLMKVPILTSYTLLDHSDMKYKSASDVMHVINYRPLNSHSERDVVLEPNNWNDLHDMSCVARYTFFYGAGAHNSLGRDYKIDASMSYYTTATGNREYASLVTNSGPNDHILDISGKLDHGSIRDISFSARLRRNNANPREALDISLNTQTIKLDFEKIWQIPTDLSFVKAMTLQHRSNTLGNYVVNEMVEYALTEDGTGKVTGKFTNKPDDLSHIYQRLTFDFSGGYFPTNEMARYIKDISYSVTTFQNAAFNGKNHILDICDTIQRAGDDDRIRRITFDICSEAINYNTMWLKVDFSNVDVEEKNYCLKKQINAFLDAKMPERDFNVLSYKDSKAQWLEDPNVPMDPVSFNPSNSNTKTVISAIDAKKAYFNQLRDASLTMYLTREDAEISNDQPSSNDISFEYHYHTYEEYVRGSGNVTVQPFISLTDKMVISDTCGTLGLHMSWKDISKGVPSKLVFNVKDLSYTTGANSLELDSSVSYPHDSIIKYIPPKARTISRTGVSSNPDVCSNVTTLGIDKRQLHDVVSGMKISLMATSEVQIDFGSANWSCSYDMIPKGVGNDVVLNKPPIQRVIKSLDISYGTAGGIHGLIGYTNNDISCIPGTNNVRNNSSTSKLRFEFDASNNTDALTRYRPHAEPLHDISINVVFYTDLTHTDTSTVTWVVQKEEIDWLNPPTVFHDNNRITRYTHGNTPIVGAGGSDVSFSVMRDTSSTLVMNQRFHPLFEKRYTDDNSGMIVEMSLNWAYHLGDGNREVHPFVINKYIVTPADEYDQSYMLLNLSWQDMSKGLLVTDDASSVHINMRVHTTREKNDTHWNDISFDIPASSIEQYKAPLQSNWKDISCVYGNPETALTDFSLTNLYNLDPCLNLLFDVSFGMYGNDYGMLAEHVIKDVSYSWLDRSNYTPVSPNKRAIVRLDDGRDYLQLKLLSADMSKGVPDYLDVSAMHIRVEVYRDRAKTTTDEMVRCISMGIAARDISYYVPPTNINNVKASSPNYGEFTMKKDEIMLHGVGDLSLNIDMSNVLLTNSEWKGFYSDLSTDYIENKSDIILTYNGVDHPVDFVDISSDRKTIITRIDNVMRTFQTNIDPDVKNASINITLFEDLEKINKIQFTKNLNVNFVNATPSSIKSIQDAHLSDFSFSIFGGSTESLNEGISFEVLVEGKFNFATNTASSDYIVHQPGGSIAYKWDPLHDNEWRNDGVSDISISMIENKSYVTFKLDASHVLMAGSLDEDVNNSVFDVSMHLYNDPTRKEIAGSRAVQLKSKPTVSQVKHFKYPKSIENVSSTLANGVQFGDASMTLWSDSSLNLIVPDADREWFTSGNYGYDWKASDYVIDASISFFTTSIADPISFSVGVNDISFIDSRKMALSLKFDDVSKGCLSGGHIEISMNICTDLRKETTDFSRILHMVVPHTDISYYRPPTRIITEDTKASLTNESEANRVVFTDASFTTWRDCSLTFRLDEQIFAKYGSDVTGLISEVTYSHDFSGGATHDTISSTARRGAISYDISSDATYITVRTRGDDLSAGAIPKTRNYDTWIGDGGRSHRDLKSHEISFNVVVYSDLAKTPAIVHDISMVLKEGDISYYRPPLWFFNGVEPNVFDISSEINGTGLGINTSQNKNKPYELCFLQDTSVNLTICNDAFTNYSGWMHPSGFPDDISTNWIAGISLENASTFPPTDLTQHIDQHSIEIIQVDGKNIQLKFGMTQINDYINPAKFKVRMYNDRSKSESRTHDTVKIVRAVDISQNTVPETFIDTFDDIDDDFSINLMPRPLTDTEIGITLKFVNQLGPYELTSDSILQYNRINSDTQMKGWTNVGITNYKLRVDDLHSETYLDASLDVACLWDGGWPSTYPGNYIDFSLSIFKTTGNDYANTRLGADLLVRSKVNFFYVNTTGPMDVSAIGVDPTGGNTFSLIRPGNVRINATPSAEHFAVGTNKTYETRLYFDDISYHVRDISWVYNAGSDYEVSGHYNLKSNEYLAALSNEYVNFTNLATFDGLINPKTVDMPVSLSVGTDVSGVQFHMCDVADLSRGLPGDIIYTMNVYDDLSYTASARTYTPVSHTIPYSAIKHYKHPKRVLEISFQNADTGAYVSPDITFSNLYDLSVNFDLSFDVNDAAANFYQHLRSTNVTVQHVVKDLTFSWNDGPPIHVEHTDMSLVSSTELQFKVLQNDISTYPDEGISFNVLFFKDMAKTGNDVASLLIDIGLAIDGADMQKYEYPKSVLEISFQNADTGAYFSPDIRFSNLYDLSVNFDLSFDVNDIGANFYKHLHGSNVTVQNVVSDLSFVWNDGRPIRVEHTDMSLVSSTELQFKVLQNDISTYPDEGISFNVLLFKDRWESDAQFKDVNLEIVASDISTVTIPTEITKFKAYRLNADTGNKSFYDDCSLSLIDASGTGHLTELATLAYCSISFDEALTQERLQIGHTSSFNWPITFDISRVARSSGGDGNYYGFSGEIDQYGVSYENVTLSADGRTLDFSFDVSPILHGLTSIDAKDCLKFRLRYNTNSLGSTDLIDQSGTELFHVPFQDISYYDGRKLLDASNFAAEQGGIPAKASEWGGSEIDFSFSSLNDISMQVRLPFKAIRSPRFSFKLKSSNTNDFSYLSIHNVVRDISISYSPSVSVCLSGDDLSGRLFRDGAGETKLEFRIPKKENMPVDHDISMTVYFKTDLCGNATAFGTEYIDASYVIPKAGVNHMRLNINSELTRNNNRLWQNTLTVTGNEALIFDVSCDTSFNLPEMTKFHNDPKNTTFVSVDYNYDKRLILYSKNISEEEYGDISAANSDIFSSDARGDAIGVSFDIANFDVDTSFSSRRFLMCQSNGGLPIVGEVSFESIRLYNAYMTNETNTNEEGVRHQFPLEISMNDVAPTVQEATSLFSYLGPFGPGETETTMKITSFRGYNFTNGVKEYYEDCSLSLIDASGTGHSTELATLAYCSISFDNVMTQSKLNIGSDEWPITFDISRVARTGGDGQYYGFSGEIDQYGVSYENITLGADQKSLDFSFDVSPILQGLTSIDPKDCLKFRLRYNNNPTGTPEISGTELFHVPFQDISYYDGRKLLDASNFEAEQGGIPAKASEWGGSEIDFSFSYFRDISMQVKVPFKADHLSRFSLQLKSSNADDLSYLSIHNVVRDISISYSPGVSVCLSGDDLSGRLFRDGADETKLEFRIPKKENALANNDISMTVYFKTDLCGNATAFGTEYIDASYVIPKAGVEEVPEVLYWELVPDFATVTNANGDQVQNCCIGYNITKTSAIIRTDHGIGDWKSNPNVFMKGTRNGHDIIIANPDFTKSGGSWDNQHGDKFTSWKIGGSIMSKNGTNAQHITSTIAEVKNIEFKTLAIVLRASGYSVNNELASPHLFDYYDTKSSNAAIAGFISSGSSYRMTGSCVLKDVSDITFHNNRINMMTRTPTEGTTWNSSHQNTMDDPDSDDRIHCLIYRWNDVSQHLYTDNYSFLSGIKDADTNFLGWSSSWYINSGYEILQSTIHPTALTPVEMREYINAAKIKFDLPFPLIVN